jgi:hypothetical protein
MASMLVPWAARDRPVIDELLITLFVVMTARLAGTREAAEARRHLGVEVIANLYGALPRLECDVLICGTKRPRTVLH